MIVFTESLDLVYCGCGGIGIRARLRGVWLRPCEFESRHPHKFLKPRTIICKGMQEASLVVVMVSNGPGELSTWVKPLAEQLHSRLLIRPRYNNSSVSLRLVLVPCPNSTGTEKKAASKWNQFEQITSAKNFWSLLINPRKYGYWPSKGLVIFLGGDQFWSVLLAARLGYLNTTYAEWVARWPYWNDRIFAMSENVKKQLPKNLKKRCIVVGDLMADISNQAKIKKPLPEGTWIALLPGSKKAKLSIGIPFFLELADQLAELMPNCRFFLPVAPTTSVNEIISLSTSANPIAKEYSSGIAKMVDSKNEKSWSKLITNSGTEIFLNEEYPAHTYLSQCNLALTTVGANTAELAALAVPMIVVIPTQHLNLMEAWDGLLGIFARLPFLKKCIGIAISLWRLRQQRFMAWPNISAGRMVVPERMGIISPKDIAKESYEWLSSPQKLNDQKQNLIKLRGSKGAVKKTNDEIIKLINSIKK